MEEAHRDSILPKEQILVTVATLAHAGFQIVIGQELAPLMARKL